MAGTNQKHVPLRKCVGCGQMKPKMEMMRVIRPPEGMIELDLTGRKNGRGAYLCRDAACLEKAVRNRGLERSLKTAVGKDLQQQLLVQMEASDD